MLTEPQQTWVDALKSGKYKQAKGVLHAPEEDAYCCLGVACELFREANPGVLDAVNKPTYTRTHYQYRNEDGRLVEETTMLPEPVRDWLGLNSDAGNFTDGTRSLVALNDSGATFGEIAEIIEEKAEVLFNGAE